MPWEGRVWLNPPYSNVHEWLEKLLLHGRGIALVNTRTDTQWFQRYAQHSTALKFLRGRVKFIRPDGIATNQPIGSVLIAYGQEDADALAACPLPGLFMRVESYLSRLTSHVSPLPA